MASAKVCRQLIKEIKKNGVYILTEKKQFDEICAQKKFSDKDNAFLLKLADRFRRNPGVKKMWIEGEMREVRVDYSDRLGVASNDET